MTTVSNTLAVIHGPADFLDICGVRNEIYLRENYAHAGGAKHLRIHSATGTACGQLPINDYRWQPLYAVFLRLGCHAARVHIVNFDVARVTSETLYKFDGLFASRTTSTKNFNLTFPCFCHYYFSFSKLKLSRIGHSLAGPLPQQVSTNRTSVFFIARRCWTFPSMSAIFASARFRTSARVLPAAIRKARSSLISFSEKPSSCARLMNRTRRTLSGENCR